MSLGARRSAKGNPALRLALTGRSGDAVFLLMRGCRWTSSPPAALGVAYNRPTLRAPPAGRGPTMPHRRPPNSQLTGH